MKVEALDLWRTCEIGEELLSKKLRCVLTLDYSSVRIEDLLWIRGSCIFRGYESHGNPEGMLYLSFDVNLGERGELGFTLASDTELRLEQCSGSGSTI